MNNNQHTSESLALIYLFTEKLNYSTATLRQQLEEHASPLSILEKTHTAPQIQAILQRTQKTVTDWEHDTEAKLSTLLDPTYPRQVLDVWDCPPLLFSKGNTSYSNLPDTSIDCGISIVGSRKPSSTALYFTEETTSYLCQENITIISGLAEGIDQRAHATALSLNSRTVGVIGTGLGRYYPVSARPLQEAMEAGEANSMVLTQFTPMSSPTPAFFPMRNGLMSAYGYTSIIVEASEKSGTRHQAAQAIKHGRPLILTTQVANNTTWGRKYSTNPIYDVHVVHTPLQAAEVAFTIIEKTLDADSAIPEPDRNSTELLGLGSF